MTALRACFLIASVAMIALVIVALRNEQARLAARTLALESQWVELRRELWKVQTGVARLRAPARLYGRLDWFRAELVTRDVLRSPRSRSGTLSGNLPRD